MLGHDGPPQAFWKENLITGEPLERCPLRTIQLAPSKVSGELALFRLEVYPFWKKGHLPRAGGVEDQNARQLAMLRELDRVGEIVQERYRELSKGDGE